MNDLLICPSCGKLPKVEQRQIKDSFNKKKGEILAAKCIANGCPMSLMNWMLIDDWNKRFVVSVNGKDYFVGDIVGIEWVDDRTNEEFIIPMTIGKLENGSYYLIPPENPVINCWKIHISVADEKNGIIEFIELEKKENN